MNRKKISIGKFDIKENNSNNDQYELINNLKELIEREKESRCYFQIERDKLAKILQIEKEKYNDLKAKNILLSQEIDDLKLSHNEEITSLKIKVRYLVGEHNAKLNDIKLKLETNQNVNFKLEMDEFKKQYLNGLHVAFENLNKEILINDELLRKFKANYLNEITKLVDRYTEMAINVQNVFESRLENQRENFNLILRSSLHEITETKNQHLEKTKKLNENSFNELKSYFKDLTKNLIDSVKKLDQECSDYKIKLKLADNKLKQTGTELVNLRVENQNLKTTADSNQSMARLYLANRRIYKQKDKDFSNLKQSSLNLEIKYESLLQIHDNLKKEHDSLNNYLNILLIKLRIILENVNYLCDKKVKLILDELAIFDSKFSKM